MADCEKILDEKEKTATAQQKRKRSRTSSPRVCNKNPRIAAISHGKILDTLSVLYQPKQASGIS